MASSTREDESLLTSAEGELHSLTPAGIRRKPLREQGTAQDQHHAAPQWQGAKEPGIENIAVEETATSSGSAPELDIPLKIARSPVRWWCFEILSILIAAICLGGIVLVLVLYNGKSQESWPSEILTINGLIAILATTCRTCFMVAVGAGLAQGKWQQLSSGSRREGESYRLGFYALFDEAAKGPWGSSRLIWQFKGLHLTCLGAAISILSLAFSVFSQQLVSLRIDTVESHSLMAGQVSRASRMGYVLDGEEEGSFIANNVVVSPEMRTAVFNGFMAPTIDWPQVTCPSGNCTWPIVPTLGVCGTCVNVTETLEHENISDDICTVSYGEDLVIEGYCEPGINSSDTAPKVWFASGQGSDKIFDSRDTPVSRSAPNLIANFTGLRAQTTDSLDPDVGHAQATECALWYCVQAHQVSVRNGQLHEKVVDTWHEAQETKATDELEYTPDNLADFVFVDGTDKFNSDAEEAYFVVSWEHERLRDYFGNTAQGVVRGSSINVLQGEGRSNETGGDFTTGFYINFMEAEKWIDRIAKSMTNAIRTRGLVGTKVIDRNEALDDNDFTRARDRVRRKLAGKVLTTQATIVVRWGWIVYLVALVVLSMAFLVAQIVQTASRVDIRPWKDDPLASLWISISAELRQDFRVGLEQPKGIAHVVGEMPVQVTRQQDGLPTGFHVKQE